MPSPPYFAVPEEPSHRFELLSAYLDGEVNAQERQQVQQWLDQDPQFKSMYLSLLRLNREIEQVPIPIIPLAADQISKEVLGRIAQENRRYRFLFGSSLVLMLLGAGAVFNGVWNNLKPLEITTAQNLTLTDPLVISLNAPLFALTEEANLPYGDIQLTEISGVD